MVGSSDSSSNGAGGYCGGFPTFLIPSYYETVKYAHIEDRRLGCLRLLLILCIVTYVVVVEMWQMGGYLEANPIVGVIRFSLQQPTAPKDCDPTDASNNNKECQNDFVPLNKLKYCQQYYNHQNSPREYSGKILPCEIYEAMNAQNLRETSMIVWTRATTYNQTLICDGAINSGTMTCPRTYDNIDVDVDINIDDDFAVTSQSQSSSKPFYIAQSEAFTVLLDHSVTSSRICENYSSSSRRRKRKKQQEHYTCSAQADQYEGRLYSTNSKLCHHEFHNHNNSYAHPFGPNLQSTSPCYIGPNHTTTKNQDFFSLDVLLKASSSSNGGGGDDDDSDNNGVSLDDCITMDQEETMQAATTMTTSEDPPPSSCTTYRESGATLLLNVVWNDFQPYKGIVEPYYYYRTQVIGSSYKESLPYYHAYRQSRTLFVGHGIKIAVLLGGNFHQFQFIQFLITLTTALGLLAVATTIVDSLMLYVLPEKQKYQQVKYETVIPSTTTTASSGTNNDDAYDYGGTHGQQLEREQRQPDNEESVYWWDWLRRRSRPRPQQQVLPSALSVTSTNIDGSGTISGHNITEATRNAAFEMLVTSSTTATRFAMESDEDFFQGGETTTAVTTTFDHNNCMNSVVATAQSSSEENLREPLLS